MSCIIPVSRANYGRPIVLDKVEGLVKVLNPGGG